MDSNVCGGVLSVQAYWAYLWERVLGIDGGFQVCFQSILKRQKRPTKVLLKSIDENWTDDRIYNCLQILFTKLRRILFGECNHRDHSPCGSRCPLGDYQVPIHEDVAVVIVENSETRSTKVKIMLSPLLWWSRRWFAAGLGRETWRLKFEKFKLLTNHTNKI